MALYSAILSSIFFWDGKKSTSFNPFGASSSPFSTFIRSFLGFIISLIVFFTFVNANVKPCTVNPIDL